ncbi:MAG TPA: PilN domain-containing protein [Gemmatimonadales bacterium]|nr:PilN domain-containing protein [Gemmatimonadales bacterium]
MMITVNLRPGQKRKRAGGGGKEFVERFRALGTRIKDPMLMAAAVVGVLVGGYLIWGFVSTRRELASLQPRLEQVQDEHKRFEGLLQQKKRAETIRDSLLAQIHTIRAVDGNRYVWPHVLDEVAKSLPPYTWLTSLAVQGMVAVVDSADTTERPMQFKMEGRTMDLQAYTRFLRQLEASPWLQDVTPLEASTIVELERPVTKFTIQAAFKQADSAYIRTVPLSQSVR